MSRGLAPPEALGWTHVWDGGREQVRLTDAQAAVLVFMGMIEYSGLYRVYRVCEGSSLDAVKRALV